MTEGRVFFRMGAHLPKSFASWQAASFRGWTTSVSASAHDVDMHTRAQGWHFMWLAPSVDRLAFGMSADSAFRKAMRLSLDDLIGRFNVAELVKVERRSLFGLHSARVRLASRHIQQCASLGLVDEATFRMRRDPLDA